MDQPATELPAEDPGLDPCGGPVLLKTLYPGDAGGAGLHCGEEVVAGDPPPLRAETQGGSEILAVGPAQCGGDQLPAGTGRGGATGGGWAAGTGATQER